MQLQFIERFQLIGTQDNFLSAKGVPLHNGGKIIKVHPFHVIWHKNHLALMDRYIVKHLLCIMVQISEYFRIPVTHTCRYCFDFEIAVSYDKIISKNNFDRYFTYISYLHTCILLTDLLLMCTNVERK